VHASKDRDITRDCAVEDGVRLWSWLKGEEKEEPLGTPFLGCGPLNPRGGRCR
jgi:hypothetical protein